MVLADADACRADGGRNRKLLKHLNLDEKVGLHVLMGGVEAKRWVDEPEKPAILIGTQDMLLSRALNRGYAMGHAAWPRAFGLLNSDALWVMDEVQLMGVGLATSAQIQAFAQQDRTGKETVEKPRCTWWMSATLQPGWLKSPETGAMMPELTQGILTVEPKDRHGPQWEAKKPVQRDTSDVSKWPETIVGRHQSHLPDPETGRQTLVVVNTVKQARELHGKVEKHLIKEKAKTRLHLIHSRFRPADRESWISEFLSRDKLGPEIDRILIATQVVEAGVDISASCLITELAPWPSLVQRFGRSARYGGVAEVVVLDQKHTDEKKARPYSIDELGAARDAIDRIEGVSIGRIEDFEAALDESEITKLYPYNPLHVLLRDEFEELFDTSPDLSGADMDISRFIREGNESRDLQVFWRSWEGNQPTAEVQPDRRELCTVPIGETKAWIKNVQKRKEPVWFMGLNLQQLDSTRRLLIEAELQPVQGHRFQPTGFPDLGPATYQAGETACLLLESAQSMANRLEGTIWDEGSNEPIDDAAGISYVAINDEDGNYLTSSIIESHRLNSPYILESKDKTFFNTLKDSLAVMDTGPINRRAFADTLLKYDINSLLHGIFLAKKELAGGRLRMARVISSFIEAECIQTAASGGVKNDHVDPQGDTSKGFGNVPFHREEFTAEKITAYFSIDLQQVRAYGLGIDVTRLLTVLALYKVRALLDGDLRLRTACDLELKDDTVVARKPDGFELPNAADLTTELKDAIKTCKDKMKVTPVTFKK